MGGEVFSLWNAGQGISETQLTFEPVDARLTTIAGFLQRAAGGLREKELQRKLATERQRHIYQDRDMLLSSRPSVADTEASMANKSDKRVAAENAATLRLLKYGTATTQVCCVSAVRLPVMQAGRYRTEQCIFSVQGIQLLLLFFFQSQRTRSHITLYALTSLPSLFLTFQLISMGSPRLSPTGSLVSAGDDLSQAGLTQYMMDVVFVTWAAQIVACVWSKGWWIYASVCFLCMADRNPCRHAPLANKQILITSDYLTKYHSFTDTRFCSIQDLQSRSPLHLPLESLNIANRKHSLFLSSCK